jgi:hypothetical protein
MLQNGILEQADTIGMSPWSFIDIFNVFIMKPMEKSILNI